MTVPAGTFAAVRVDSRWTDDGIEHEGSNWYAPGVGLVRMAYGSFTSVLTSFTPGR